MSVYHGRFQDGNGHLRIDTTRNLPSTTIVPSAEHRSAWSNSVPTAVASTTTTTMGRYDAHMDDSRLDGGRARVPVADEGMLREIFLHTDIDDDEFRSEERKEDEFLSYLHQLRESLASREPFRTFDRRKFLRDRPAGFLPGKDLPNFFAGPRTGMDRWLRREPEEMPNRWSRKWGNSTMPDLDENPEGFFQSLLEENCRRRRASEGNESKKVCVPSSAEECAAGREELRKELSFVLEKMRKQRGMQERAQCSGANSTRPRSVWRSASFDSLPIRDQVVTGPSSFLQSRRNRSTSPVAKSKSDVGTSSGQSKYQRRYKEEMAQLLALKEAELCKKFRATPVPAASLLPRYDRIIQTAATKSSRARAARAEDLAQSVKEFSFARAENARRSGRTGEGGEVCGNGKVDFREKNKRKKQFSDVLSKVIENAMEEGRTRHQKQKENEERAGLTEEHVFHPRVNHEIPDFRSLQEEFASALADRKAAVRAHLAATTPRPFAGLSSRTSASLPQPPAQVSKIPVRPPSRPIKGGSIRPTTSTILRAQTLQRKQSEQATAEQHLSLRLQESTDHAKEVAARVRRRLRVLERGEDLYGSGGERGGGRGNTRTPAAIRMKREKELKKAREEARARAEEYERSLTDMKERVNERPCLFENALVEKAKEQAKKAFAHIVASNGLRVEDFT